MSTPKELSIRKLTLQDVEIVSELYRYTTDWMGVKVPSSFIQSLLGSHLHNYLEPNRSKVLYGAFYDHQLILTLGVYYWDSMPFCTLNRLVGKMDSLPFILQIEAIKGLMDLAIDEMESRQIYRFYALSTRQHQKSLALFNKISKKLKNRYVLTIEEIIPAHCEPKYKYVWQIMDLQTWPSDLVLRSGTALSQVRTPS